MTVLLEYLYRDAGNNKRWGNITLSNRDRVKYDELRSSIRSNLIDGEFFVAETVGLPTLYFESHDPDLDHGWHQFHDIQPSNNANDDNEMDILEFIQKLQHTEEI